MDEELIPNFITNFSDTIERLEFILLQDVSNEKMLVKEYYYKEDGLTIVYKTLDGDIEVARLVNKNNKILFYEKIDKSK
jgi:hypothetical protein